jgi:tyrosinase
MNDQQELYKQVRKIADQATSNHELWNAAADAFRVPYWDWNLGEKGGELPDFFTTPMITVAGPDEIRQTITNPLYQYEFHPVSTQDFAGDVCPKL